MKTFKELKESKYGDAMSSRLPAHLDDPRIEDKKKPVVKKFDYKKFSADRTKHPEKFIAGVKESVWEAYRDRALLEQTERERASHQDRMGSTLDANHNSTHDQVKKDQAERGKVSGKTTNGDSTHHMLHMSYKPGSLKESEESYKVGDRVVPKIGPHKGEMHRVIHVHSTGHVNITPELRPGSKNRYHLGAARAHPKDLDRHLTENASTGMPFRQAIAHAKKHGGKVTYGTASRMWHSISPSDRDHDTKFSLDPDEALRQGHSKSFLQSTRGRFIKEAEAPTPVKQGWLKNRGNQFHKWPEGVKTHNINPLTSRKTVREAFQAAKDKKDPKLTTGDFDKPKELQDPGQAMSFGGKDNGASKEEKKSNTPAPEKKGNKLVVQGAGPDDAFQSEPIVTPLTTLPDTASPKSGSQGVR